MKILKSNSVKNNMKEVYCTDDPKFWQLHRDRSHIPPVQDSLHHQHRTTDYEFLRQYFPEGHRIFENFNQSYFYKINLEQTQEKRKSRGMTI